VEVVRTDRMKGIVAPHPPLNPHPEKENKKIWRVLVLLSV